MSIKDSIKFEVDSVEALDKILEELKPIQKQTEDGEYYLIHNKGFTGKPIDQIAIREWRKYKEIVDSLTARLKVFKMGSDSELNKKIDSCWNIIDKCNEFLFGIKLKGYNLKETENLGNEIEPK